MKWCALQSCFAVLPLAVLLLTGTAQARTVTDWNGFRAGFSAAVTFGDHPDTHTGLPPGPASNGNYTINHGTSGWQAGLTGGYFWQQGPLVEGLEGNVQFGNAGGTQTLTGVAHRDGSGASPSNFLAIRERIDTTFDLRGTLGLAVTRHFLPYVTGGWFYEHGYFSGQFHDAVPTDFIVRDGAGRSGWTLGAGLACRFNEVWVLKAEYLYYDVGRHAVLSSTIGGLQSQFDFGGTGGVVRVALTLRVP